MRGLLPSINSSIKTKDSSVLSINLFAHLLRQSQITSSARSCHECLLVEIESQAMMHIGCSKPVFSTLSMISLPLPNIVLERCLSNMTSDYRVGLASISSREEKWLEVAREREREKKKKILTIFDERYYIALLSIDTLHLCFVTKQLSFSLCCWLFILANLSRSKLVQFSTGERGMYTHAKLLSDHCRRACLSERNGWLLLSFSLRVNLALFECHRSWERQSWLLSR